jgi:very-short-patch-repair endonuclease
MGYPTLQSSVWALAKTQHGVVARRQLLARGITPQGIKHRVAKGRLHRVAQGIYAVGRPEVTRHGVWMAAVLTCGPEAALSHHSAAALWGIRPGRQGVIDVSIPASVARHRPGIHVHRRRAFEVTRHRGIPVTTPTCTLVDLAAGGDREETEAAVNQADALDLIDPETLRSELGAMSHRRGIPALKTTLDRRTFRRTDSWLERRFLALVRRTELSLPQTQRHPDSVRVDFLWPELGLIVEADSLRYHRTPAQQATDRRRDQRHAAAGLTTLRFTHAQIRYEPGHVEATLNSVASRLKAA